MIVHGSSRPRVGWAILPAAGFRTGAADRRLEKRRQPGLAAPQAEWFSWLCVGHWLMDTPAKSRLHFGPAGHVASVAAGFQIGQERGQQADGGEEGAELVDEGDAGGVG